MHGPLTQTQRKQERGTPRGRDRKPTERASFSSLSPRARPLAALEARANQRPQVVQLQALGDTLNGGAQALGPESRASTQVVQRVVELGKGVDPRLETAVEQIQREPTFRSIALSPAVTLIVNRSDAATEAWMKTPRNRHQLEGVATRFTSRPQDVDYLVTINDRQLAGLPVEKGKAYPSSEIIDPVLSSTDPLGTEPPKLDPVAMAQELNLEMTPSLELLLLGGPSSTFKPTPLLLPLDVPDFQNLSPGTFGLGPRARPISRELGLDTVLLHELGHVSQYMREVQERTPKDADLVLHPPEMRDLQSPAVERALSGKGLEVLLPTGDVFPVGDGLDDPIWTHLRTLLNALRTWLHDAEGYLGERKGTEDLRPEAQRLEELMAQAQLELGLWIEYDVMSNVEHPYALPKGEPIRTRHGEEALLGELVEPVDFLSEASRGPRTLKNVRGEMVERAQTFSMDLPLILAQISVIYAGYVKQALPILKEIRE